MDQAYLLAALPFGFETRFRPPLTVFRNPSSASRAKSWLSSSTPTTAPAAPQSARAPIRVIIITNARRFVMAIFLPPLRNIDPSHGRANRTASLNDLIHEDLM